MCFVITWALLCIENRFRSGDCMERKTNHFNDCDRSFLGTEKQTRKRKKKTKLIQYEGVVKLHVKMGKDRKMLKWSNTEDSLKPL